MKPRLSGREMNSRLIRVCWLLIVSSTFLCACASNRILPGAKTLNTLVGKSRAEIVRKIGEPSTTWNDPKTGGVVLVYTTAAVFRGNGESLVFPGASLPTVYHKSKLLYLDKNGVCSSWKKF